MTTPHTTPEPTQEEKQESIAIGLGWTRHDESYPWPASSDGICKRIVWKNVAGIPVSFGPPLKALFEDLNACHKAENALTEEQHSRFRAKLWDLTQPKVAKVGHDDVYRAYISATAQQRAEALWMTLKD